MAKKYLNKKTKGGKSDYIIRKARYGDGKKWVEMWNCGMKQKFFSYTGSNNIRDKKDVIKANKIYTSGNRNEFSFVAIDNKTGKIIGSCGAFGKDKGRTRHRVEMGWMVHPNYAGLGIATKLLKRVILEAKKRGIKRVEAEAALENVASVRLAQKCGLKIEGKRKNGLLLDDERYVDTYLFGKIIN